MVIIKIMINTFLEKILELRLFLEILNMVIQDNRIIKIPVIIYTI